MRKLPQQPTINNPETARPKNEFEQLRQEALAFGKCWYNDYCGLDSLLQPAEQYAQSIQKAETFQITALDNDFTPPDPIQSEAVSADWPPVSGYHGYFVRQLLKTLQPKIAVYGAQRLFQEAGNTYGNTISSVIQGSANVINISMLAQMREGSLETRDQIAEQIAFATRMHIPILSNPGSPGDTLEMTYASFEDPIIVGGFNLSASGRLQRNETAPGARVDIYAPGRDVAVVTSHGIRTVAGHSFASPFVAVACAIIQANLNLPIPELKRFLHNRCCNQYTITEAIETPGEPTLNKLAVLDYRLLLKAVKVELDARI